MYARGILVGGLRGLRTSVWERGLGFCVRGVSQKRSTLKDEGRGHAGIVAPVRGVPTRNCLGISLRNTRIESLFNTWTTGMPEYT